MLGWESFVYGFWWIFPIILVFLCLFMILGCAGCFVKRRQCYPFDSAKDTKKKISPADVGKNNYKA
jgi:hypothetical protein